MGSARTTTTRRRGGARPTRNPALSAADQGRGTMTGMRIAITGASGLIGSALTRSLSAEGHEVVRLVRRAPSGPGEVRWDPEAGTVDTAGLAGTEAIVHLAVSMIRHQP